MDKKRVREVLKMIAQDQEDDAIKFDGQPFTGKTVAEYLGNLGAAIAALADILNEMLEDDEKRKP